MKNIFTKLAVLSIAIVCGGVVCSCKESYISPEYIVPSDTIPYEKVMDEIPIVMAMNDPSYITITRGAGAIAPDNADSREDAEFYVYSFLANNYAYQGEIDYASDYVKEEELPENEPMKCLIDDPATRMGAEMRLQDDDVLNFVNQDITYFYSQRNQEYKYKFFCYHLDDAEILDGEPMREKDNIHMNIRIDGTQDIIHSVADITDKQVSGVNADNEKWLLANLMNRELVFSTITGHRLMAPVFNAKHAMSRFSFNLIGEDGMSESVYIQDIYVMAHRDWKFTVAADDVSKVGIEMLGDENLEQLHLCDDIGEVDGGKPSFEEYKYSVKQYEEIRNLGKGMLLPPRDRYDLFIKCAYIAPNGNEHKYLARYNLTNRTVEDDGTIVNNPFESGRQYNVTMHVYGFRQIELSMNGLDWGTPEDIYLTDEDIMDFE